jgi:hypothetical protein
LLLLLLFRSHVIKKVLSIMICLESSTYGGTMKDEYMVTMFAVESICDIKRVISKAFPPPVTMILV